MKILVISNLYPPHGIGGYEERCLHTVEALRNRGHQVYVLTSNHKVTGREAPNEKDVYRLLEIHGFYGHPWLPIYKLYGLEKRNQITLKEQIGKIRPDVVHVWNMGGITKSLLLTLEQIDIPLVYDISDHWIARSLKADVWLSWWNNPGSKARHTLRTAARHLGIQKRISKDVPTASVQSLKFNNIYFCSSFMRALTTSKGYPVSHADIIYCGVEADLFTHKKDYNEVRNFIWVGRLSEDKDPLTTIRGFLRTRNKLELPLTLDLFGRGDPPYVESLMQVISEHGADEYIRIKSATHKEMRALYSQYDAYIFSSNWGEPFALTPLEAMSAKVPVIMCPDGGDAELLKDGINALAFNAGDEESLSKAIERLINTTDCGKQIAENAILNVKDNFTVDVMTNSIESFLTQAAGKS